MQPEAESKDIHRFFVISLILKGWFAFMEIAGGIATYFITQQFLYDLVLRIVHGGLIKDPNALLENQLLRWVGNFSLSTQTFVSLYLLSHGLIKLGLIVGLLRKVFWCYPLAIVIFGLFTIYQIYRYTHTHSIFLIFVTILDVVVIVLTWLEYRNLR